MIVINVYLKAVHNYTAPPKSAKMAKTILNLTRILEENERKRVFESHLLLDLTSMSSDVIRTLCPDPSLVKDSYECAK